jgi:hypothetical protein
MQAAFNLTTAIARGLQLRGYQCPAQVKSAQGPATSLFGTHLASLLVVKLNTRLHAPMPPSLLRARTFQ